MVKDRDTRNDEKVFLDLIEEIYRTGSETHDWADLLGNIARFVGATSGIVGITDHRTGFGEPDMQHEGLDEDLLVERWFGEFNFDTPWARLGPAPAAGDISTGASRLPIDELRRLPLYARALEPLGIEDCLVTALETRDQRSTILALYRDRTRGAFGPRELDRFRPLVPHLVRSAHLERLLLDARIREKAAHGALDELGFGVFRIREFAAEPLNRQAEFLLQRGDGLVRAAGRLRASDPTSDRALQAGIRAAGGGRTPPPATTATPFPLRRGPGRLSLTCWTLPLPINAAAGIASLDRPGGALLFVGDPEDRPDLPDQTVARLFDLTAAEARLASAIAIGETPREYAERQGISENTVRWTLKRIQSKLGVHRQLDIAGVLLRTFPPIRR